ncbi:MAG: hypothetical protein GXX91_07160, partial [Verrucomicrobiaceae bacterium]|nr:hypothetical protein [Verrucomicrobiaceae bacterium]
EETPESLPALKALARIADQQKRTAEALSLHTRLVALLPSDDEDAIAIRLRKAALHRLQQEDSEALAEWNGLLAAFPANTALRTEIVSLLLEAGETDTAITVLTDLAASGDSRQKLNALLELNRLHEFLGDFDGATAAAREALALLHFKNHEHGELFSRLVQIHERFDRLEELERSLVDAASGTNPTEATLFAIAEFYRLTAHLQKEEKAVGDLVRALPGRLEYRIRLADIQMANDHYDEAAATLDEVLQAQAEVPLHLILRRARIAIHGENRAAASQFLSDFLGHQSVTRDGRREIIDFARDNYLDDLVERLLRDLPGEDDPPGEQTAAPIELARFLHERGRREQALETLRLHVAAAGDAPLEKATRLSHISSVLKDLDQPDEALAAIDEALDLFPDNHDFLSARADLYIGTGQVPEAISQLEAIWHRLDSFDARAEIDQRLFSLLRGHYSTETLPDPEPGLLQNGKIPTLAQYHALAAAASRTGRGGDEPPPKELLDYYEKIKATANETPTTPARYRAAWWAFKLQDNHECFQQLNRANEEAGAPVVAVEKMLLSLAELNERPTLMVRHLSTLIEIDPDKADDYRQRRAGMRFELGFEDEAVRELKALAAKPNATLNTLGTLARVYQRQGSTSRQIEVWQHAYRDANAFEKRNIIKQLSSALIEAGRAEEALRAQLDLLERESDPVQRRKQLDTQLTVAGTHFLHDWLLAQYEELSRKHPFDRFYPEALARVHKAAGNEEEAFALMKKAYYMSGQNEELLAELGALSDHLGDLKSAIYYRRQLLARGQEDDLENWKILIEMLEKDLQVAEADQLRHRLETKFGTDTDFLGELTDRYLKEGRPRDAERTLARLVELRNWDLGARFRLALLRIQRGESENAFAALNEILDATAAVDYPDGFGAKLLPLVRLASLPEDEREAAANGLDTFVFTVEAYPFIGGNLQEEIAAALQRPKPEFTLTPKEPHLIRLRAIEEAAALASALGKTSTWLQPWQGEDRPYFERLWATRYARATGAFATLLEQYPDSGSHTDQLLLAYSRLLAGQPERFLQWVDATDSTNETQHPRSLYAGMAALLLCKDNAGDPLYDPSAFHRVFAGLPFSKTVAAHFFSELRKTRRFEETYRLGALFGDTVMDDEGTFHFALSQVAGLAGLPAERVAWLDRSLAAVRATTGTRSANHFYAALTERLSLLESDPARRDYLRDLSSWIADSPSDSSAGGEKEILLSLAAGDTARVIEKLRPLARRRIERIPSSDEALEETGAATRRNWPGMSRLLHYYADRLPLREESAADFVDAIGAPRMVLDDDPHVTAQYEQFEIDRHLLLLDWRNAPERDAAVRALQGRLTHPDSNMELAKALERRGFHREAIPVYHYDAIQRDRDYAPLQGLFDAASEALEPAPALAVIERIHSREFPAPPGLTIDYLNEQHARFLLLDRNVERLEQLGRPPVTGKENRPFQGRSHLPYQNALVLAYRQSGDDDALLPLLTRIQESGQASAEQLLLGAEILGKSSRHDEALRWLSPLALDPGEPTLQRRALHLSLTLLEARGGDRVAPLRELTLATFGRQPTSVTRTLATALHRAGAPDDAIAVLHLLRRRNPNPAHRSATSQQLLRLERERGTAWSALRDEVETFLGDFVYGAEDGNVAPSSPVNAATPFTSNASHFAAWIAARPDENKELADLLGTLPSPPGTAWLGELVRGFLQDDLARAARIASADADRGTFEHILETLPSFGPDGIAAARSLLDEKAIRGDLLFRNEPARQVTFFHRIGDRPRLIEVHQRLALEARSDLFHQHGLEDWLPTLDTRHHLPALFAAIGETELADGLFRAYDEALPSYHWNHLAFLNGYGNFLVENGHYERADSFLQRVLRKSLRIDLRLVPRLYQAWGKAEQWEEHSPRYHLTRGQEVLVRTWFRALAEGRELPEPISTW